MSNLASWSFQHCMFSPPLSWFRCSLHWALGAKSLARSAADPGSIRCPSSTPAISLLPSSTTPFHLPCSQHLPGMKKKLLRYDRQKGCHLHGQHFRSFGKKQGGLRGGEILLVALLLTQRTVYPLSSQLLFFPDMFGENCVNQIPKVKIFFLAAFSISLLIKFNINVQ